MRRHYLPVEALSAWTQLTGVSVSGIAFRRLRADDGTDKGYAVIATEERGSDDSGSQSHPEVLIKLPSDLILSLEAVRNYAKSDRYLQEVLEAVGDFGKVCR